MPSGQTLAPFRILCAVLNRSDLKSKCARADHTSAFEIFLTRQGDARGSAITMLSDSPTMKTVRRGRARTGRSTQVLTAGDAHRREVRPSPPAITGSVADAAASQQSEVVLF